MRDSWNRSEAGATAVLWVLQFLLCSLIYYKLLRSNDMNRFQLDSIHFWTLFQLLVSLQLELDIYRSTFRASESTVILMLFHEHRRHSSARSDFAKVMPVLEGPSLLSKPSEIIPLTFVSQLTFLLQSTYAQPPKSKILSKKKKKKEEEEWTRPSQDQVSRKPFTKINVSVSF